MSKYLILIYENETSYEKAPPEVMEEVMREHDAFTNGVPELGANVIGGEALHPTTTATSIRGGTEVTDGPFVETKEQLGGFSIIDVAGLDAALAWAQRMSEATTCAIEVRPFLDEGS